MEETTNGRKNKKNKARDNKTKERIRQVTRQQMEETTNGRNNKHNKARENKAKQRQKRR
jgi:hypothetical protein